MTRDNLKTKSGNWKIISNLIERQAGTMRQLKIEWQGDIIKRQTDIIEWQADITESAQWMSIFDMKTAPVFSNHSDDYRRNWFQSESCYHY